MECIKLYLHYPLEKEDKLCFHSCPIGMYGIHAWCIENRNLKTLWEKNRMQVTVIKTNLFAVSCAEAFQQ